MLSDGARFSCPQLLRYPNGEPREIKRAKYIPTLLFFSVPLGTSPVSRFSPLCYDGQRQATGSQLEKMQVRENALTQQGH